MNLRVPAARRIGIGLGVIAAGVVAWVAIRPASVPAPPVFAIGVNLVRPQIAITGPNVVVLAPDGTVWCWGIDELKVGRWRVGQWLPPHRLGRDSDWAAIAGGYWTVALKTNGTLWQWTGSGVFDNAPPQQVTRETNWQAIATGVGHVLALKSDGTLWGWGDNDRGQVGDGTAIPRTLPVRVGEGTNWVAIAAGSYNSAGLQRDGSLWVWGGPATSMNFRAAAPSQVGSSTNWTDVCAAGLAFVARQRDGRCWLGGFNTEGFQGGSDPWARQQSTYRHEEIDSVALPKLLDLERPPKVGELVRLVWLDGLDPVAASYFSVLGRKTDGTLWACGANSEAELGDGTKELRRTPTRIGHRRDWVAFATSSGGASVGLCSDGTVWGWGLRFDTPPQFPAWWKLGLARWRPPQGIPWPRWRFDLVPKVGTCATPELILRFKPSAARRVPELGSSTP